MDNRNGPTDAESQSLAKKLRLELKEWEQSFAATHQGRKAAREDIKQHPEIAHKYKQYARLRGPSSKQSAAQNATPSKKRTTSASCPIPSSRSPYKRPKHAHLNQSAKTPTHDRALPKHLSPGTFHMSIGPTPQKDGQVLGLFDQLSAASNSQTPSKRKPLRSLEGNMLTTPCKHHQSKDQTVTRQMHQKSPLSGAKNHNLLTPPTRCAMDHSTPAPRSVVPNLRFDDTPAFLRRDSQRADMGKENISENEGVSWSPVAIRKPPKAAGRALSALVRGLREMEDEGLDEELDALREMESESASRNSLEGAKVRKNDRQRPDMPLGPDGGLESDENGVEYADDRKGRDGRPLKAWKKKGQKRTTRRVIMKPNTAKWKPEMAWKVDQADRDDEDGVAETRTKSTDRLKSYGYDSDDYEDIEGSQEATRNVRRYALDKSPEKKKGSAKSVKKKISATAHANFRALHIKNKQFKVKKGGKFGRKR